MYNNILTSIENAILTITINRETKLNALNIETLQEIKKAVDAVQSDKNISGIILTGAGSKAFAAGADISEFVNFNKKEGTKMSADGHEVMNSIERSAKPVIAAVNGTTNEWKSSTSAKKPSPTTTNRKIGSALVSTVVKSEVMACAPPI